MSPKKVPFLRTPERQNRVANMSDALAQMQRSGSLHFVKALPKTALPDPTGKQTAKMSLPQQFVRENGDKIEELVFLRAQTSTGRSSRSWPVHACFSRSGTVRVQIVGGWSDFATDNRLKEGDFVVFLLREDAKSEFEVHFFHGPQGSPYFPDQGVRRFDEEDEEEEKIGSECESEKEENTNNQSRFVSPNQAFSRDIRAGNSAALQHTGNHRVHHPRFIKRLVASHIGLSTGELNSA